MNVRLIHCAFEWPINMMFDREFLSREAELERDDINVAFRFDTGNLFTADFEQPKAHR